MWCSWSSVSAVPRVVSSSADTNPVALTGVARRIRQDTSIAIFCIARRFAASSLAIGPARLAQVLAHRHGFGEADVDLAVVALALRLDEVVQPGQPLGCLLAAAGVGGVLGGLVQLVEADRHRLEKDVVAATVEVGVGDVS